MNTAPLTKTELEILQHMALGKMYKEIALSQGIKEDTVKKHASNIYKKLQVRNRTEALIKVNVSLSA